MLNSILESALSEIEAAYTQVYEHHYPPMRFLAELGYPIPKSYQSAAEFILNAGLRRALSSDPLELENIKGLLEEVQTWQVELDAVGLSYLLQQSLEKMMTGLATAPEDVALLGKFLAAIQLAHSVPFPVDLWRVQNQYYQLLHSTYPGLEKRGQAGDESARAWLEQFVRLGKQLSIRVG